MKLSAAAKDDELSTLQTIGRAAAASSSLPGIIGPHAAARGGTCADPRQRRFCRYSGEPPVERLAVGFAYFQSGLLEIHCPTAPAPKRHCRAPARAALRRPRVRAISTCTSPPHQDQPPFRNSTTYCSVSYFSQIATGLDRGGVRLSGNVQLPNVLQNPPEAVVRGEAHGSIRIQEGEPDFSIAYRYS